MSIATVAKKDFQDSARSRWLWALTVLFILFVAGLSYLFTSVQGLGTAGEDPGTAELLVALLSPSGFLVPIIGIMISYKAIVGERESGTLKVLLSLPHKRGDVVLGKFLGRSLSLSIAIILGYLVGLIVFATQVSEFNLGAYVVFLLLTLFFGVVYISIGVGLSSLTASTSRALALAIGFIVLFEFIWQAVPIVLVFVVNGFELPNEFPEWAEFLATLSPSTALSRAANVVLSETSDLETVARSSSDAFYLQNEFGLVILLVWLVVPLTIGYVRFKGSDLS